MAKSGEPRRNRQRHELVRAANLRPLNPWPHMTWPEAIVRLELNRRHLEYTYRWFKPEWSPMLAQTITNPAFQPEFTLPNDKTVILVIGSFWGTIPGVIDRNSLAKAILESEGWRVVVWYEADILQNVNVLFTRDLPKLEVTKHTHGEIVNPYEAHINYREQLLRALAASRRLIKKTRSTRTQHTRRHRRRTPTTVTYPQGFLPERMRSYVGSGEGYSHDHAVGPRTGLRSSVTADSTFPTFTATSGARLALQMLARLLGFPSAGVSATLKPVSGSGASAQRSGLRVTGSADADASMPSPSVGTTASMRLNASPRSKPSVGASAAVLPATGTVPPAVRTGLRTYSLVDMAIAPPVSAGARVSLRIATTLTRATLTGLRASAPVAGTTTPQAQTGTTATPTDLEATSLSSTPPALTVTPSTDGDMDSPSHASGVTATPIQDGTNKPVGLGGLTVTPDDLEGATSSTAPHGLTAQATDVGDLLSPDSAQGFIAEVVEVAGTQDESGSFGMTVTEILIILQSQRFVEEQVMGVLHDSYAVGGPSDAYGDADHMHWMYYGVRSTLIAALQRIESLRAGARVTAGVYGGDMRPLGKQGVSQEVTATGVESEADSRTGTRTSIVNDATPKESAPRSGARASLLDSGTLVPAPKNGVRGSVSLSGSQDPSQREGTRVTTSTSGTGTKPAPRQGVRTSLKNTAQQAKPSDKSGSRIVRMKYDLTHRSGSTLVTIESGAGGTEANAQGLHDGTFSNCNGGTNPTSLSYKMDYADFVNKTDLTITSVKLYFYTKQTGTALSDGNMKHQWRKVAGPGNWTVLETFTGDVDNSATPKVYDITASITGWSDLNALTAGWSASWGNLKQGHVASVDAVEVEVIATRTDTL